MAAGVQQPFEISVLSNDEIVNNIFELKAYPNPTSDILILAINSLQIEDLNYSLLDINGKLLLNAEKITASQTTIPFTKLPSGTYLLQVTAGSKNVKTFKIIKK